MRVQNTFSFKSEAEVLLLNPREFHDRNLISEFKELPGVTVLDTINSQVAEWIKLQNPSVNFSGEKLNHAVADFFSKQDKELFGIWVYYPWKSTLLRVLPEDMFIAVRTVRNKYKITEEEQVELSKKSIGVVGLSVGQSVALALAMERGCGELRLADFDVLELGNMNRLRTGLTSIGLKKTTITAREILEIDPYIKVKLFDDGINESNLEEFLFSGGKLDMVVDECDSLDIKVLLREKARSFNIPVLMDTSDRGMLDIERFDLEPDREIFHGLIGNLDYKELQGLTTKEKLPYGLKITGLETLSDRMQASLLEINQSITSWPQLASAVFLGGGLVAHASREILLGKNIASGRFYVDFDEILKDPSFFNSDTIQNSESPEITSEKTNAKNDFPVNSNLSSQYRLSKDELQELITCANTAPSGGNCQPWEWVFDQNGVLHLYHDQERSASLLDFKGTGSLIAFGAAIENIRLYCGVNGISFEIKDLIEEFDQKKILSLVFTGKSESVKSFPFEELYEFIGQRCTDRLNEGRKELPKEFLNNILNTTSFHGVKMTLFQSPELITELAKINGVMDYVRMTDPRGYEDFLKEVRWTPEEAASTKDGIDLNTFDFSPADWAVLKLLSNKNAMGLIRKFNLGKGFTKISDETFASASAVGLLHGLGNKPVDFFHTGMFLQRIWLIATLHGVSLQPVTASLFLFQRCEEGENGYFSKDQKENIQVANKDFRTIAGLSSGEQAYFMFRLSLSHGQVVRSFRRDFSETLTVL